MPDITDIISKIPYRLALAGGWIDQPFVSRHNPHPPGSMVVVQIEPTFRPMDRAGIAKSAEKTAEKQPFSAGISQPREATSLRQLY